MHFFDIRNEASEKVVREEEIYFTALFEAASFRHVAVVQALIKVVADANQRIPHSEWQAIHASSAAGGAEIVETLLAAGAPVDSWLAFVATPLCLAVRHDHPDVVDDLLKANANPNNRDDEQRTMLKIHIITESVPRSVCEDIAGLLVRAGAKTNVATLPSD